MRHQQSRRSRSRSRKGPNPLTRSYESNGPDVKVRGTASTVAEKYLSLARDAQSSGDIVAAENYLQHAEHYSRIVMAAQAQYQPVQQTQHRDEDGYDEDRQANGRGPNDRFDYNGETGRDEDDGDGFEGEDEDTRSFQPQGQGQAQARSPRSDDRNQGSRPDRYEQRNDRSPDRGGYRSDRDNRSERSDRDSRSDRPYERDARGDRPERDNRGGERSDRDSRSGERSDRDYRADRSDRDSRGERQDRSDRDNRGQRPEREEGNGRSNRDSFDENPARLDAQDQPIAPVASGMSDAVDLPQADAAVDEPAPKPTRRRSSKSSRAQNGADQPAEAAGADGTPDGAAALAAFPD